MLRNQNKVSEETIWAQFKMGSESAFEWIFEQYFPQLFAYAHTICNDTALNEEEIQDLFVQLWEKRAGLGDTDSIKHYLLKSLRRKLIKSINRKRSQAQNIHRNWDEEWKQESFENKVIDLEVGDEKRKLIEKALNKLSRRRREVLYLKFFQNKSNQEISDILSISIESTYKLVHSALKTLKIDLEKISLIFIFFLYFLL